MGASIPTRWRFFSILFLLSFMSYQLRQNVHVAGEFMMPELGLSEIEMGWVYAAFIWGYALFQIPGGALGKRFGSRRTLLVAGLLWLLTAALTAVLPGLVFTSSIGIIGSLLFIRFLTGLSHAPMFPIQAAAVERWFPVGHWALPNSLSSTGLTLGAALTQPLVAVVVVYWGWRASFFIFIPFGLMTLGLWWWYARDAPELHPNVTAAELLLIQRQREHLTQDAGDLPWRALLSNRETGLLTLAYFSQCFVFYLFFTWFFHYLVVELGFTVLETGVLAALPWVTGAVTATIGGAVCDRLCRLLGPRLGCRIPAMMGLTASGGFLYLGLYAGDPYIAVALLSLCFAGTQFTEGAFWSAQTYVAGPYTAPACALMNTGGNLAGIIVAPLMPYLASHIGWVLALSTGGGVAFFGAAVWLWIRADVPLQAPQAVR